MQSRLFVLIPCALAAIVACAGCETESKAPRRTPLNTRLLKGADQGKLSLVKQLVEAGADVNAVGDGWRPRWTPLHAAARNGHKEVAEFLISKGARVNVKDADNNTPLHWAVLKSQTPLVKVLLAAGADANAEGQFELTPLDRAKQMHCQEIEDLLRKSAARAASASSGKQGGGVDAKFGKNQTERQQIFRDMIEAVDELGMGEACKDQWKKIAAERKIDLATALAILEEGFDSNWSQPPFAHYNAEKKAHRRQWIKRRNERHAEPMSE